MDLENIEKNIRYCFTAEDTGMKFYQTIGAEVDLLFC